VTETPTIQPTASLRPMPAGPDDLTAEWMTAVMQAHGLDAVVGSVKAVPFAEGAGMLSLLVRAELEYAHGSGPASVIVKMPILVEANRKTAVDFHCYEREVQFYQRAAGRTPARTPVIYHADLEGDNDFVIVMEDFRGYHIGDQIVGCTVEQARLCMATISELHASFWNGVDEPGYEFIPYEHPSYMSDNLHQGALTVWDTMEELAGDALPAELRALKSRYLEAIPRLQAWVTEAPRTIVHGDFRMDNLYLTSASGTATRRSRSATGRGSCAARARTTSPTS